jgi:hypothetical protein
MDVVVKQGHIDPSPGPDRGARSPHPDAWYELVVLAELWQRNDNQIEVPFQHR